jgi:hypothetical protein
MESAVIVMMILGIIALLINIAIERGASVSRQRVERERG